MNSALKSLVLSARQHGVDLSVDRLTHDYNLGEEEPDESLLLKIASENKLTAKSVSIDWGKLINLGSAYPVITPLNNGRFVIVAGFQQQGENEEAGLKVLDPMAAQPKIEIINQPSFEALWDNKVILIKRNFNLLDEEQPFSMQWIVREFVQQKILMSQLIIISFMLHIFSVLPAVYIMIVLDKVVNYEAYSTLYVIATGIAFAYIFNGVLSYVRQYIILFFSTKLDVKISTRVFSKLLDLPLEFFHQNSASSLVKSVQQTVTLRKFISNRLLGTVLDATALLFFIPILLMYSPTLFAVIFIFGILISISLIISSKAQQELIKKARNLDSKKQEILMNSITGIETVKSLALEPIQKKYWEEYVANHVNSNLDSGRIESKYAQITSTLQQLMTVAVIFTGVLLVFEGEVSAGVIIGFNMLASKVISPLIQIVKLITSFDQINSAIKQIAFVFNERGETRKKGLSPEIKGHIVFNKAAFKYKQYQALSDISFTIKPRQKVAIVGASGSGKSTLARMIQGLITASAGTVSIDGQDIRVVDIGHLRVNMASVTQDSALFSGSLQDNIIKPMPSANMERVLWASKLAGLHEEIEKMNDGYETLLEEGGSNLSTGQRQKIAIARALIRNPKILILDEALSNIGIESELDMMTKNLLQIRSGRTLIIVTHRIASIKDSDLILVIKEGQLIEQGKHESLLAKNGHYKDLWMQERILSGLLPEKMEKAA